ncbi:MAG TPA: hypothetical protein VN969_24860 [Streptosporangiaceae bacterium]|nr:hypothetical protein [Streptosporangiaceae bacterium]
MTHSATPRHARPVPDQPLQPGARVLAGLETAFTAPVPDAPAGRHADADARAWERAALQSVAARLGRAAAACLLARTLAGTPLPRSVPARRLALHLLDFVATAAADLDEAHRLACELARTAHRQCIHCGAPVARVPGSPQQEHLPASRRPAARTPAPDCGHRPARPASGWTARPSPGAGSAQPHRGPDQ